MRSEDVKPLFQFFSTAIFTICTAHRQCSDGDNFRLIAGCYSATLTVEAAIMSSLASTIKAP